MLRLNAANISAKKMNCIISYPNMNTTKKKNKKLTPILTLQKNYIIT
jgi:hypothetical protein